MLVLAPHLNNIFEVFSPIFLRTDSRLNYCENALSNIYNRMDSYRQHWHHLKVQFLAFKRRIINTAIQSKSWQCFFILFDFLSFLIFPCHFLFLLISVVPHLRSLTAHNVPVLLLKLIKFLPILGPILDFQFLCNLLIVHKLSICSRFLPHVIHHWHLFGFGPVLVRAGQVQ